DLGLNVTHDAGWGALAWQPAAASRRWLRPRSRPQGTRPRDSRARPPTRSDQGRVSTPGDVYPWHYQTERIQRARKAFRFGCRYFELVCFETLKSKAEVAHAHALFLPDVVRRRRQ